MAISYSFRSALNGFNREDVVRHLEYINTKHTNQINQLKSDLEMAEKEAEKEAEKLRKLEALEENLADLQASYDRLQQEKSNLEAENAALLQKIQAEQSQKTQAVTHTEEELEAYRRAERMERQTQQRTRQLCQRANGILADAGVKVDEAAANISAMADQVAAQLNVLQETVISSKTALREAATAMCAIRPEAE